MEEKTLEKILTNLESVVESDGLGSVRVDVFGITNKRYVIARKDVFILRNGSNDHYLYPYRFGMRHMIGEFEMRL